MYGASSELQWKSSLANYEYLRQMSSITSMMTSVPRFEAGRLVTSKTRECA